ncbi:MAG: LacI family DNA-binding transcriptional regulator [Kiritimatiellae bacterium]|nr:LacI family DNA-binding transcriptional regulator [Kiritimatiellia bacterium]
MATDDYGMKQRAMEGYILERIRDGRLKRGGRAPSDRQLAERFGVSEATANKVLSALASRGVLVRRGRGGGTFVSSRLGAMGVLGFVMPAHTYSFFWRQFAGACNAALTRGYALQYVDPGLELSGAHVWEHIAEAGFAGLVCATLPPRSLPMPAVLINCTLPEDHTPYPTVNPDNEEGGYRVGCLLLDAGHRDMVIITPERDGGCRPGRADGFVRALRERGIERPELRVYRCVGGYVTIPTLVRQARKEHPELTAIAAATDPFAADVIRTLLQDKVKVPRNVSVTGFGNLREIYVMHRITSVEQHPEHIGARAAELLMDWIAAPDRRPKSLIIPCDLVPGDTVAVLHAR